MLGVAVLASKLSFAGMTAVGAASDPKRPRLADSDSDAPASASADAGTQARTMYLVIDLNG
ncbi:MAG: hypothetical protein K0R99_3580 [Microbacterium sp.]|jgi:hypothetical protein|uniref:hypothetical protein n=1 Tax=Microbacterium sp. TaxID=51671 RepID=UPI00262AB27A|nr:hypothetical protein [Microbacterium sp.]MDF2562134.1 hypothetical protein [Microbacterium sp.]